MAHLQATLSVLVGKGKDQARAWIPPKRAAAKYPAMRGRVLAWWEFEEGVGIRRDVTEDRGAPGGRIPGDGVSREKGGRRNLRTMWISVWCR